MFIAACLSLFNGKYAIRSLWDTAPTECLSQNPIRNLDVSALDNSLCPLVFPVFSWTKEENITLSPAHEIRITPIPKDRIYPKRKKKKLIGFRVN